MNAAHRPKVRPALTLLVTTALGVACSVAAASTQVTVVRTDQEVKGGMGMVMINGSLEKYPISKIERISPTEVHLLFETPDIPSRPEQPTAYLFAMGIVGDTGDVVMSDVRPLEELKSAAIPCSVKQTQLREGTTIGSQDLGQLFSVLSIRGARREVLKEQLNLNLSDADIKELNNLEALFGLADGEPISRTMNVHEFAERLYRLDIALERLS